MKLAGLERTISMSENAFDYGKRPPHEVVVEIDHLSTKLSALGLGGESDAENSLDTLRRGMSALFVQWEAAEASRNHVLSSAAAILFNRRGKKAFELNPSNDHIKKLGEEIRRHLNTYSDESAKLNEQEIAQAMTEAANQHHHDLSWPFVRLPTEPDQPYGRLVLETIQSDDQRWTAFIAEVFFPAGSSTLRHSHLGNRSFTTASGPSTHCNSQWQLRDERRRLKFSRYQATTYDDKTIVVVPTGTIHRISRPGQPTTGPSLADLAGADQSDIHWHLEEGNKFADQTSLHIYHPDPEFTRQLQQTKESQKDPDFLTGLDMVLFETNGNAFVSTGGAWVPRTRQLGPEGEHCGACFNIRENVARKKISHQSLPNFLSAVPTPVSVYAR